MISRLPWCPCVLSLAFSLLLTARTPTVEIPHRQATVPAASGNRATVYIMRPSASPVFLSFPVRIDGKPVASLPNRTYTWLQIASGSHLIEFRDPYTPVVPYLKHRHDFVAGKTYFFGHITVPVGIEGPRVIPIGTTVMVQSGGPIVESAIAEIPPPFAKPALEKLSYVAPLQ